MTKKQIMEKMFKEEKMSASYESPSVIELQVSNEGVLCQSGTEGLTESEGDWGW